jgi:hypothetical protein
MSHQIHNWAASPWMPATLLDLVWIAPTHVCAVQTTKHRPRLSQCIWRAWLQACAGNQTHSIYALPESTTLPSALKNTRQSLCRVSHSAKRARHTVHRQSLLCRVLFIGHSAKKSSRYGAGWQRRRLCRVFAVTLGKGVTFAECLPDSTRQRIRQRGPHVRYFAECFVWHSTKRASLPSVRATTLGKEPIPVSRSWFFAECYGPDTRQSDQYTPFLFVFPILSIQTKDISQISHIYITDHHRHI